MMVTEYENKFKELSEFIPYMILNKSTKKQSLLDKLNEEITLCILGTSHSTYWFAGNAALEVERQRALYRSRW